MMKSVTFMRESVYKDVYVCMYERECIRTCMFVYMRERKTMCVYAWCVVCVTVLSPSGLSCCLLKEEGKCRKNKN
jgi:hypothetical protein